MYALNKQKMLAALQRLDELIEQPCTLIIGGGGSMVMAHDFPLSTMDIDGYPVEMPLDVIEKSILQVAKEQSLSGDWLNPYFSTFVHTLPQDYAKRLHVVFSGKFLIAKALGKEELLVMKCFAHRPKDVGHAKSLIKDGVDVSLVEAHIESLQQKKIPGAEEALDFLDDLLDQL